MFMTNVLHTLEKELLDQVLAENPEFVKILAEISTRHGVPPLHIALISNFLQKDVPIGTPVEARKFESMCQLVEEGLFSVVEHKDRLELIKNDLPVRHYLSTDYVRPQRVSMRFVGILAAITLLGIIFLLAYVTSA
jgi:hypothetical protein